MKKSNGFTLVEVIVSLGVLGIIAIAFGSYCFSLYLYDIYKENNPKCF